MTDENTSSPDTGLDTKSKTQALIEAARRRNSNAERADEEKAEGQKERETINSDRVQELAEGRQELADVNVQARAKTLTGAVDPLAMGDVKGDGRDAKDYPDSDPDKRFGVTTAEVGLNTSQDGADGELATTFGHRVSKRTLAELSRGRQNLEEGQAERDLVKSRNERIGQSSAQRSEMNPADPQTGRTEQEEPEDEGDASALIGGTAVTDAEEDPDGTKGDELAADKSGKPKLEDMTKAELIAYGKEHGVDLDGSKNKPELLADAKAIQPKD